MYKSRKHLLDLVQSLSQSWEDETKTIYFTMIMTKLKQSPKTLFVTKSNLWELISNLHKLPDGTNRRYWDTRRDFPEPFCCFPTGFPGGHLSVSLDWRPAPFRLATQGRGGATQAFPIGRYTQKCPWGDARLVACCGYQENVPEVGG